MLRDTAMQETPLILNSIKIGFISSLVTVLTPFNTAWGFDTSAIVKTIALAVLGAIFSFLTQKVLRKFFPDRDMTRLSMLERWRRRRTRRRMR